MNISTNQPLALTPRAFRIGPSHANTLTMTYELANTLPLHYYGRLFTYMKQKQTCISTTSTFHRSNYTCRRLMVQSEILLFTGQRILFLILTSLDCFDRKRPLCYAILHKTNYLFADDHHHQQQQQHFPFLPLHFTSKLQHEAEFSTPEK